MKDLDKTNEKMEQDNAWDESDEVVKVEIKKPLDKVIPIRLSSEKWEQLRREANELGIGPTTLARMWILKALKTETKWDSTASRKEVAMVADKDAKSKYKARSGK
jgi:hypothetical protein